MSPRYDHVLKQVRSAISDAPDTRTAMERTVALLQQALDHYTWAGIYLLEHNELVLGPFVGKPSPHTRIPLGRGICGAAAAERATIVVDDVRADPRYLACSVDTQSEVVVPIMHGGAVLGEIDIDSDRAAAFGPEDRALIEAVARDLADAMTSTKTASARNVQGKAL